MSIVTKGVAIITGAASGIGRAVAIRLARDGFSVSLNDLQTSKEKLDSVADEISSVNGNVISIVGDVSKEKDVQNIVNKTVKELGSLNVMVANAGICLHNPLVELDTKAFDKTIDVNLKGVLYCYRYAASQMIKQGKGGRIIGASSITGKQGMADFPAYVATKFAIRGLTQSAALELGKYGITVNAYAPGVIDTEMTTNTNAAIAKKTGMPLDALVKPLIDMSAVKRIGNPEDIASLVSFIASANSSFITGQTISSNGGVFFD
ncbi:acetoin reductase family [Pyrrhoderma noxium]|uniref:Acetoin reductase family n=1 Tax=Pyrrhoderma noxium TaxID=2282107 RepID=A0A286U6Q1_9AGAM|nr:acetoin reductase family [Pyrrhoderma noxium]